MPGNWDNPATADFGAGGSQGRQYASGAAFQRNGRALSVEASNPSVGRDRKCSQKIYVDGLFPPHVRPASVLIGTRGMNHIRMQTSGCTVQLRGKGCSQPTSQKADEPVHLLVKYDTEDQFERFKGILREIVDGYESQAPRRPNGGSNNRTQGSANAAAAGSISTPIKATTPTPTSAQGFTNVLVPGWNVQTVTEAQVNSESDFLWLLKVYLVKEQSAFLDEVAEGLSVFFCIDSIRPQLAATSISPGPNQLRYFIQSCPHVIKLILEPGVVMAADGQLPSWSRPRVALAENVVNLPKDGLKELHKMVRREQAQAAQCKSQTFARAETSPTLSGRTDLEANTLSLMVQALHHLIADLPDTSFVGLEDRFYEMFRLPLKASTWGYPSVVAFVKAYPSLFRVTGAGREMRVSAVSSPDFGVVSQTSNGATQSTSGLSALAAATAAVRAGRLSATLGSRPSVAPSYISSELNKGWQQTATAEMSPLFEVPSHFQTSVSSAKNPHSAPASAVWEPSKSAPTPMSVAQKAPRLLGILSKLPRMTINNTQANK